MIRTYRELLISLYLFLSESPKSCGQTFNIGYFDDRCSTVKVESVIQKCFIEQLLHKFHQTQKKASAAETFFSKIADLQLTTQLE